MKARIVSLIEFDEIDLGCVTHSVSEFLALNPKITRIRVWDEEADKSDVPEKKEEVTKEENDTETAASQTH